MKKTKTITTYSFECPEHGFVDIEYTHVLHPANSTIICDYAECCEEINIHSHQIQIEVEPDLPDEKKYSMSDVKKAVNRWSRTVIPKDYIKKYLEEVEK